MFQLILGWCPVTSKLFMLFLVFFLNQGKVDHGRELSCRALRIRACCIMIIMARMAGQGLLMKYKWVIMSLLLPYSGSKHDQQYALQYLGSQGCNSRPSAFFNTPSCQTCCPSLPALQPWSITILSAASPQETGVLQMCCWKFESSNAPQSMETWS